jgi:hypothetical protein
LGNTSGRCTSSRAELAQDRHRQVLSHLETLCVAKVLGLPLQFLAVLRQLLLREGR